MVVFFTLYFFLLLVYLSRIKNSMNLKNDVII